MARGAVAGIVFIFSLVGAAPDQAGAAQTLFQGRNFDIPDPAHGGRGGQIYLSRCASCHDEGIGRAPQRALFPFLSPQAIYRTLKQGPMRTQAQGLSDGDEIAVAEFLTRKKMSAAAEEPEPPKCKGEAARFDSAEPPIFSGWGFTPANTRFVRAKIAGIAAANVGRLRLKWAVAFPNAVQVRSQPALAGGAVYVGSNNGEVYALDRASGCARWIYQAGSEVRTAIIASPWRAGDAAAKPLLYFGDFLGFVYAVDARTGRLVWRARADANPDATITGAPTLFANTLYVPVSSMEGLRPADPHYQCCHFRGSVVAYDAANGAVKWQTFSTDTPQFRGKNAIGTSQYGPSGAPIWNSPAIDERRQQLYVGTGQNYSSPANDKSDAVLALELKTGAVKWVFQGLAGDATNLSCISGDKTNCPKENGNDLDIGAGVSLATTAGGRQVVLAGQKSGAVYALNPDSGNLLWKVKPGRGGALGGVHFGMAANRESVFVPINDALNRQHNGEPFTEPAHPGIYAFDLLSGRSIWSAPSDPQTCAGLQRCQVGYSQAITATPDLVFAGCNDGWLRVFDAHSGAVVWQIDAKIPVETVTGAKKSGGSFGGGAGPVVYHGMLFASSGYNGSTELPANLLLAFEIK